jgi:hypothetical protein
MGNDSNVIRVERFQQCSFCGHQYDTEHCAPTPGGCCEDYWPEISRIEMEHSRNNPINAGPYLEVWE